MKNFLFLISFLLMISTPALAFQSISSNYEGLGNTPIGMHLRKIAPAWSDRMSRIQIQEFVQNYAATHMKGREPGTVITEIGFDCSRPGVKSCNYDGVYTYNLTMPGSSDQRAAVQISLTLDYSVEPWEIQGTRKFLYGGIKN